MSTVVYLANQQIQVVTGKTGQHKVNVERCLEAEAPEGSIINGIVMDTESFIGFLKTFWKENKLPVKDVTLVVNSSKFVGKIIEMPDLKGKKANDFIAREFTDSNRSENCLYSYLPLGAGEGKTKRVYAESIEPDFIKDYIELFEECGIEIKRILSGESSLIALTAMTTGKLYRTFLQVIADSNILTTILWIDGSFNYFNSMRCFHEIGTEDYAMDVARSVSQTIQFMQAHQMEQQIESLVIAGIGTLELPLYQQAVDQMGMTMPVRLYDATGAITSAYADIQKCLRCASGLTVSGNTVNFLKQFQTKAKKGNKKDKSIGINVVPIVVAAVIMVILLIGSASVYLVRKTTLDTITAYNQSPNIILSVTEYDMLTGRNQYLYAQQEAITDLKENINTYPTGNTKVIDRIQSCATGYAQAQFDAFDAKEGTLEMTASSDSVDNINRFIKKLCEQDIFSSVDYTGYAYNDTKGCWDIHVTCTLAEAAGR